ncbi:MAG: hypothetical protein AAF485_18600 [Chloroflexota bacterium]
MSAVSIGLLPWFKQEGWVWLTILVVMMLVSLVLMRPRHSLSFQQIVRFLAIYFFVLVGIAIWWQLFLYLNGTERFTFSLSINTLLSNATRIPTLMIEMGKRLFLTPYWTFIWLFVLIFFCLRPLASFKAPYSWLIIPIVGYLGLMTLTYIFSRFDPYLTHLNNSAERLILQATPLAIWWLAGQSADVGWLPRQRDL